MKLLLWGVLICMAVVTAGCLGGAAVGDNEVLGLESTAQKMMRDMLASPQFLTHYDRMEADRGGEKPVVVVNNLVNKSASQMTSLDKVGDSIIDVLYQSGKFDLVAKDRVAVKEYDSQDLMIVGDVKSFVEHGDNHIYY